MFCNTHFPPSQIQQFFPLQSNLLYAHPINLDSSLLWTACFVAGERKPLHFLRIQPSLYRHCINMDTFLGPSVSVLMLFDCIFSLEISEIISKCSNFTMKPFTNSSQFHCIICMVYRQWKRCSLVVKWLIKLQQKLITLKLVTSPYLFRTVVGVFSHPIRSTDIFCTNMESENSRHPHLKSC